jgi:hypothetical protein
MLMALPAPDGAHSAARHADRDAPTRRLTVHLPGSPRRREIEDFIRHVYARRYGAAVQQFAPALVSLDDEHGLAAAAGYRRADEAPLFLERYLQVPVESALMQHGRAASGRAAIVEVGHLAAERPGEGRRLIFLLAPHLAGHGFQWVVGTLTEELRHLFTRIGVTPVTLGTADPSVLGAEASHWGSYYDHRPLVLAGHLMQALHRLSLRPPRAGAPS